MELENLKKTAISNSDTADNDHAGLLNDRTMDTSF